MFALYPYAVRSMSPIERDVFVSRHAVTTYTDILKAYLLRDGSQVTLTLLSRRCFQSSPLLETRVSQ